MSFSNLIKHLKTVNKHRRLVCKTCFRMGLYWQGLTHDLSKYSISELKTGARYFMEDQSPHNGERKDFGFSKAWLHHRGRNKHHFEYWIDYPYDRKNGKLIMELKGMEMPVKYVLEMFADRIAASKVYKKDAYTDASPWEYYDAKRGIHVLHPKTRLLLEKLLWMLKEKGEDYTFNYVKKVVRKKGYKCINKK